MEKEDVRIRNSLKYSILDGAFYSAMVGFGESFFAAFAVFLRATNMQLGLLGSLPRTLGSLSQLFSDKLIEIFGSRKRLICTVSLLHALMYFPIALVFFFGTLRVFHLILFVCIYMILGLVLVPAWSSWMGDLVDEKERGSYFGKRNKIAGFTTFVTFLAAGYILEHFATSTTMEYMGFGIIFILALVSRLVSFIYLTNQYEPEYKIVKEARFSLIDFLKQARFHNFGLFVLYLCFLNFAIHIAAPFFTPYMLYDLAFDYKTYTIVRAASQIVKFMMLPVWGRLSDRYGTKRVLTVCGFLMPAVPVLWVFSAEVWYLILIQMYAGFVWSGFEISSFSFIFDTTSPQKRATCVAYYNVLSGISLLFGALLGGFIVRYHIIFHSRYLLIFALSCMLRYAASFIFIPKLREVREVEHISYSELLLKGITTLPMEGIMYIPVILGKKRKK